MNIDVPLNFLHVRVHGHLLLLSLGSERLSRLHPDTEHLYGEEAKREEERE